ncbi:MAG: flagellar hook-length control protein FliK [Zoogloeaceae bacterium]|uniref:flagellar hook-length control protein FliK n=1 Tax=Denitromonas sp. TaxID=2734609 RepID=UPI001DFA8AE7|nr:flagellar hook-length control protein FliK [Rhodocyclaceae bacterium]MCP5223077.1 flagellar hook-length control protein FliK [Zoogloeaceae bacterium]HPR05871.1 flagellar hook-length control protein FliK [Denitromonas sp.]
MIPGDLAARLRLLTEASFFADEPPLEPLQPARAVPSQLPEYRAGDKFSALIQKALPDGTFEAIVDGRTIKLALPQQAQVGERLALVVARNTPHAVLANPAAPAPTDTAARAALSPTGRLISFLLTGQPAPETPAIARGQPLQSSAGPLNPAALAAALRQGISESGLFYESHLARWSAGDLSTEVLRREPQARQAAPQNANQSGQNTPTPQSTTATDSSTASRGAATAQATVGARTDTIPDRLLPVMHQQLDALATHNYSWLGQAWPGQVMELEIEDPQHDDGDTPAEDAPWKTTLRLSLPTLGGVEARIALDASGIRIRLSADNPATAETLAQRRGTLSDAMGQANITVKELLVGPGS